MATTATISFALEAGDLEAEERPNQARPDLVLESQFFSRTELSRWPSVPRHSEALTGAITLDSPQRLLQQDELSFTTPAVLPQDGGEIAAETAPLPDQEKPVDFIPRTVLAQRLWKLRQKIVASGEPLLSWDDIEREVSERRGERNLGEER